jgi:hypothetical protein
LVKCPRFPEQCRYQQLRQHKIPLSFPFPTITRIPRFASELETARALPFPLFVDFHGFEGLALRLRFPDGRGPSESSCIVPRHYVGCGSSSGDGESSSLDGASSSDVCASSSDQKNKPRKARRNSSRVPKTVQICQDKVQVHCMPKFGQPSDRCSRLSDAPHYPLSSSPTILLPRPPCAF